MKVQYSDLGKFARAFMHALKPGSVVGLSGELGAGKTTLVQTIAKTLGITEPVTSPTFTIMHEYPLTGLYDRLIHIDAYRIDHKSIESTGILEAMQDPTALTLIEWPERIHQALPKDHISVEIKILDEFSREILIHPDVLTNY